MDKYQGKRVGQSSPKGPKRKLTKKQKWMVAGAAVLTVALALLIAYMLLFVRPEVPGAGKQEKDPENPVSSEEGVQPKATGERKSKDYYTILVLGRDTGGGGNCDTMMLASYDVTNQKMTVMNIPRDTMVNVSWDVKKINSVYNFYGGGEKGIDALYKEISQLVGFVPDYRVIVEWEAVGKLVDAMDGVYFEVPRDMDYEDPYQDLSIHIKKGYQKLTGEQAMGVVRFRDGKNGYNNGDIGRIETQQNFLKAVISQLLQVKNLTKIEKFAKIFTECVETDLTWQNLFWFGKSAIVGGLSMDNVNFVTMPYKGVYAWSRSYHQNLSYVVPVADELLELVNNSLSPYLEPSKMSELDIMYVNSDGSIGSTTGRVEDTKAAVPPTSYGGGSTKPETGGETTVPPETGGEATPPETGGETVPPETGGETTPPETGGETTPPESGGETTPPESGGETTPPETGGETVPPESGGETTPPDTSGEVMVPPSTGGIDNWPVPGEPTQPAQSAGTPADSMAA
ncbi:LCP family protein [Oscillibacter hominis]|uniref:LCP family protein n=1 Tax=Oscillibacter hominis TaxID=2763056 RepID=A0A7G9B705_9FIRM|nr:LCP family protein [Oscillibacter hominis]QNL45336.1 LCP family protein [Oscillibacter hominis]